MLYQGSSLGWLVRVLWRSQLHKVTWALDLLYWTCFDPL